MTELARAPTLPPIPPLGPGLTFPLLPDAPTLDRSLILTPGQPAVLLARPGEILTLSFRVRNLCQRPVELERELELGAGLRQFGPQLPFVLEPAESVTLLAHLQTPHDAPAGSHRIRLLLRSRGNAIVRAAWDATVELG